MVSEFIVGIAMLGTEHASHTRVTSPPAIRFVLDPILEARRHVPSYGKAHRTDRARIDTTANRATWTGIESGSLARLVEHLVEQNRRAKRYPGTVDRMDHHADDARAT
jgi:hypothetical protein